MGSHCVFNAAASLPKLVPHEERVMDADTVPAARSWILVLKLAAPPGSVSLELNEKHCAIL